MKTKGLIDCGATTQLICAFVFAYAKGRISHDAAHMSYIMRKPAFTKLEKNKAADQPVCQYGLIMPLLFTA